VAAPAGVLRLLIAVGGGWVAIHWFGAGLPGLFSAAALGLTVFGVTVAMAIRAGVWEEAGRTARDARPSGVGDKVTTA
jgi:hypothetical protein